MGKQEFLARLEEGLSGLPQEDIAERMGFYSEMIDDRMEDGLSEEAAVAGIGSVEEVVSQIVAETPLPRIVRERVRSNRRLQAWEILLLVLGFPLWFPLLIAAFAIILSLYIVIWALVLSLWAVELALIVGALGGLAAGVLFIFRGEGLQGLAVIGAGLALAGLSVFLFYGCRGAGKGALILAKKLALGIKSLFLKKEGAR